MAPREHDATRRGSDGFDDRLARLAVWHGWLAAERLSAAQAEVAGGGASQLIQALLRAGDLRPEQVAALARALEDGVASCPDCGGRVPLEALQASWETPGCPACRAGGRLGRYRLLRVLGRGGMGVVWEAEDPDLGRRVALKRLTGEPSPAAYERLLREARLAAALDHPGIIAVHELGRAAARPGEPPTPFVAMALIDGGPLDEALPGLDRATRVGVLADVAEAVGFAHAAGVVHRDLKPANVLLPADGGPPVVTDFGLARATDEISRLTATGALLGTVPYMAPEQVRGARDVGPPADVWALGVMLYELLTDARPFDGASAAAIFEQILERAPVPPRRRDRSIDPALEAVCLRALERDPARRFADGAALAADLRRIQAGRAPSTPLPSWRDRSWRALRARPALAGGLLLGVLLLLGVGAQRWRTGRAFEAAATAARTATAAEDWATALAACERALALRASAELSALAARIRAQLDSVGAASRALAEKDALATRLAEAERAIAGVRSLSYVEGDAILARLREVERLLTALAASTRGEHAGERRLWAVLGAGWAATGDRGRAEQALRRAQALDAERKDAADPWVALQLGRLYFERSLTVRLGATAGERRPAESRRWVRLALAQLRRTDGWSGGAALDRQLAAAYRALASGDAPAARRACVRGLEQLGDEPGVEELWMVLSFADPSRRDEALDRALARRPHYPLALERRGVRRYQARDWAGAAADLDRALALHPRFGSAALARGAVEIERRRPARALPFCDIAVREMPRSAMALSNRSLARQLSGDAKGALIDAALALGLDDTLARAYNHRGAAKEALGRRDVALADYERALELEPDNPEALLNRGGLFFAEGKLRDALADVERVLVLNPRSAEALYRRALIRERSGDVRRAVADLDRAIAIDPGHAPALYRRGFAYQRARQRQAAMRDYTRVIDLGHGNAVVHSNRGLLRMETGDRPGARADYERALALDPGYPLAHLNLALWHYKAAPPDVPRTLACLERAIAARPTYLAAQVARAQVLRFSGDHEGAVRAATAGLKALPRSAALFKQRGMARRLAGQLEGAVADLSRSLELDAGQPETRVERALAQVLQGRGAEVRPGLARLLAHAPGDPSARCTRAELRRRLGDHAGAVEDARAAVAMNAKRWQSWLELGLALRAAGRRAEAAEAWRRARAHVGERDRKTLEARIRAVSGD